ncbi:hypothetical protein DW036_03545 [Bacteroides sp. AF39-11AC]|nr:hypothetical protein DW036_03545 [Bacteroides sp. AF39-11AC]
MKGACYYRRPSFFSYQKISRISAKLFHASMKVLHSICIIFATLWRNLNYIYWAAVLRCLLPVILPLRKW